MKIYELTLKIYLLKDINQDEALEKVSELIDGSLSKDKTFLDFHNRNEFKFYNFNSLHKIENDGIYRRGRIYSVRIRTAKEEIADFFRKNLSNQCTEYIKSLEILTKKIQNNLIEKIYSITPIVIKTESGYWKGRVSIDEFEKRLRENLIKKYNSCFGEKLNEDFELFERIEFLNQKPISSKYKNINILGDKLEIHISSNETAQKLALLSLGVGLGEMSSRGYGYVNYKFF